MPNPSRCLLALLLAVSIAAAAPKKAVPLDVSGDTVLVVKSFPCQVTAKPGADLYFWNVPPGLTSRANDNVLTITTGTAGTYTVSVTSLTVKVDFDKKTVDKIKDTGEITLNIGGIKPPEPPPSPGPSPGPVPSGAMRVLIVYEAGDLPNMKKDPARREQADMLFDPKFKGALTDRTDKNGPDKRGWNIWDKDLDVTAADKFWQDAMARKHDTLPYLHVFKGNAVAYEGPLPKSQKEALDLINKYAGE